MPKLDFKELKRMAIIIAASFVMALNIKSFVKTGGLYPGGFTGLSLLIQHIFLLFLDIEVPFSLINLLLNSVPVYISFKFIGKRFTIYSCIMIIMTSLFTDILTGYTITYDPLLVSVFGGIINGFAISMCLFAGATSGGTDFIAIFFSEKYGIETWNYILLGNAFILGMAGWLFGWEKALYSIIFQFSSTQVLHYLYKKYQKQTLLIITEKPNEVYEQIKSCTNHDATLFMGIGCYKKQERPMLYSVISSEEIKKVISKVKSIDKNAFINVLKTEQLNGRFYQRPND